MKVVVVIPTYNEASNLPPLLEALWALPVPGMQVLIVDDESPDGTGRLAEELASRTPGRLHVLHRRGARGLGLAYVEGFTRALEMGADAIVQMDADFSHSPGDVPKLLDGLTSADVVIGSRYVTGGSVDGSWGFGRSALSRSANALARTLWVSRRTTPRLVSGPGDARPCKPSIPAGSVPTATTSRSKWSTSAKSSACGSPRCRSTSRTGRSATQK